jgi:hypothetical protein
MACLIVEDRNKGGDLRGLLVSVGSCVWSEGVEAEKWPVLFQRGALGSDYVSRGPYYQPHEVGGGKNLYPPLSAVSGGGRCRRSWKGVVQCKCNTPL